MVNKWEIYFCGLDPTVGSEQRGLRPVLILSNNAVNHHLGVCTVLPLSSVKPGDKIYPTEVLLEPAATDLPKLSVAMLQQIRTVSQSRLTRLAGTVIDADARNRVLAACRAYFEL
jgi:mRNA interferase MazF